ncbi:hypothetical protein [Methylophaga sp. OBS1]|uniref:hypothetical protein n=1 Tax=Methylophaga sp. OBS1 TaxID=2991933 RepID=UPI002257CA99|nr:hypothetical protein [Methylophaga sp. OBS1]MCX4191273.1 hypothetical protein [Methylophaga sp. OBS1]MCX4191781.1 hypothetical protein [Methylophaga sp. OBS1]
MYLQQQRLLTHHIAARLWILSFAFLMALLPVAAYFNSANNHSDTGLVSHLDTQIALHDNGLRLGLKTEQSGQSSVDIDPPDWQALVSVWLSLFYFHSSLSSLTRHLSAKASASRFLRPHLRAPPLR